MKLDLSSIYQQYVSYYSGFRDWSDQLPNSRLSEARRARLMSYEEFAATWIRWCDQGRENHWRERFEKGHEYYAANSVAAIKALFTGGETHSETMAMRDAA